MKAKCPWALGFKISLQLGVKVNSSTSILFGTGNQMTDLIRNTLVASIMC